jgi:hypothetical protein
MQKKSNKTYVNFDGHLPGCAFAKKKSPKKSGKFIEPFRSGLGWAHDGKIHEEQVYNNSLLVAQLKTISVTIKKMMTKK